MVHVRKKYQTFANGITILHVQDVTIRGVIHDYYEIFYARADKDDMKKFTAEIANDRKRVFLRIPALPWWYRDNDDFQRFHNGLLADGILCDRSKLVHDEYHETMDRSPALNELLILIDFNLDKDVFLTQRFYNVNELSDTELKRRVRLHKYMSKSGDERSAYIISWKVEVKSSQERYAAKDNEASVDEDEDVQRQERAQSERERRANPRQGTSGGHFCPHLDLYRH